MGSNPIKYGTLKAARFVRAAQNRAMMLFTAEAALFAVVTAGIAGNNYWFARRLGADDFGLSLVGSLPQMVGLIAFLPGGALADKLRDKRTLIIAALFVIAGIYLGIAASPYTASPFWVYLTLVSVSALPMAMYNSTLTTYFGETIPEGERNKVISFRSVFTFTAGIVTPLATGLLLAHAKTTSGKISLHQLFYLVATALLISQTFILRKIPAAIAAEKPKKTAVLANLGAVFKDKKFLGFMGCVMFFYFGWHADWTLWYIGQTRYVGLNEAWVGYATICGTLAQLISIPFWTKMNAKRGFNFSLSFGAFGLAGSSVVMFVSSALPPNIAPFIFLIIYAPTCLAQVSITISLVQELYVSAPEKNRSLAIAVYSMLVMLSNAIMPIVGVRVYSALGSDLASIRTVYAVLFALRAAAALMWFARYRRRLKTG